MMPDEGIEARNRLVVAHLGLVKALAARLAQRVPTHVEARELVSVGMIGLIDAANRYQPSLGVPFDAFARRRVHGAMLDSLRDIDWAPRSARKTRRDVDHAIARLRHELGHEPSGSEIARALNVTDAELERKLDEIRAVDLASVRQLSGDQEGSGSLAVAIDEDDPQVRLERAELRDLLAAVVRELPERERQILALYYEQELTLAEIGAVIGVSESRISQLRTQAIARLRSRLRQSLQLAEAG